MTKAEETRTTGRISCDDKPKEFDSESTTYSSHHNIGIFFEVMPNIPTPLLYLELNILTGMKTGMFKQVELLRSRA